MELTAPLCAMGVRSPFAHGYILSGGSEQTRMDSAQMLARAIVCSGQVRPCAMCKHCTKAMRQTLPDILAITPEKSGISVDQVRKIVKEAPILPNESTGKVYILSPADSMTHQAQNALLKTLEEPPPFVTFLLLCENAAGLLPTARSRCFSLVLPPGENAVEPDFDTLELVDGFFRAWTAQGVNRLAFVEFCLSLDSLDRAQMVQFVDGARQKLMDKLREGQGTDEYVGAIELFASLEKDMEFHVGQGLLVGKILATL